MGAGPCAVHLAGADVVAEKKPAVAAPALPRASAGASLRLAAIERGARGLVIERFIEAWDGEAVVVRRDRLAGAWIFVAIHSTRLGPAVGGTRIRTYPDAEAALADALRLARGMTYKFAASALPWGGGKAVVAVPEGLDSGARGGLLRRYGGLVRDLGGLYRTAPDVGVRPGEMDTIAETAAPYVFGCSPAVGGSGSSGPATALGVFAAIEVACERRLGGASLAGRRVLVQGAGSVGGPLIERLLAASAVVLASDPDEAALRRFRGAPGFEAVPPDAIFDAACDVFAPCALGSVLNAETVPRLRCAVVAGGANDQLASPEGAERLAARGILYAPDFVANVGGALAGLALETQGWTRERAEAEVVAVVRRTLREVFDLAEAEGLTTDAAARRIAERRLAEAARLHAVGPRRESPLPRHLAPHRR